uniref:Bifunctional inhibitor/plant lipid transfer protein/seed storage helical domain-containing protein n=1 Tax=Quercus lobata TaxID=97700 RepID=A0A7N2N806_QUELO
MKRIFIFASIFYTLLLLSNGDNDYSPSTTPASDCSAIVYDVLECIPYLSAGSEQTKVDALCCSSFEAVLEISRECICVALRGSRELGLTLNIARAIALPSACGSSVLSFTDCDINPPNSSPTAPSPSPPEYTPPSSPTTPSPSSSKSTPPIPGPPEFTPPSSSPSNPTLPSPNPQKKTPPSPSPLDYARPSPSSPKTTFPIPSPPKNAPPPMLPKPPTLVPPNSNTPVPACSNNNTKGGMFARAPPVSSPVVHAGTYSTSVSFVILVSMLIATFSCIMV